MDTSIKEYARYAILIDLVAFVLMMIFGVSTGSLSSLFWTMLLISIVIGPCLVIMGFIYATAWRTY
ncbi:MAG: hypothetical protein A4E32_01275 [Methanomassiliicoccales archaeon PtaU1.Bin124]|nr:MAG: hypothetical protein A4E32_01275 [Methanomassiliicoccales archaeon PtaU1.Bin124]